MKFKSRHVAALNVVAVFKRNITVLNYTMQSFYKFSNNEYRPILIHVRDNYCSEQQGLSSRKLVSLLATMFSNHTNIFQACPYLPGEYYIKDFNFGASHLPNVIPAGRYVITTVVRTEFNDLLFKISIYFSVANHGILDLGMG